MAGLSTSAAVCRPVNMCFCGHNSLQHSNGAAGAVSGSPGTCLICPDAHTFSPDYVDGKRPFFGGNALDESQI